MSQTPPTPVADAQRHDVLDALRGIALFGVLLVNLRDLSLYTLMPAAERLALPTAAWDRVLEVVMAALIDVKSATLFSMLLPMMVFVVVFMSHNLICQVAMVKRNLAEIDHGATISWKCAEFLGFRALQFSRGRA